MSAITFEWDSRDLDVFRGRKVDAAVARALRLAGNYAIRDLRKEATELALSRKNLTSDVVQADQDLQLPQRAREIREFAWSLFVKGKPVPVAKFPHLDTRLTRSRNGVLVRYGTGGTQRLTEAFTVRLKSGHEGVFRRRRDSRLPIDELFSSRLPANYGEEVVTRYGGSTYRKLEARFKRGLDRELGKLRRKGAL